MNEDLVHSSQEGRRGYAAVIVFVLLSYILVLGAYTKYTEHVLPWGDPFTYTVGWFQIIDYARSAYLDTIKRIVFEGNLGSWYRLMNFMLAVFSPLLAKDPASLCSVNYLVWGLGTASFFWLGRRLGLDAGRAFAVALIPWLWPVNYGFSDYSSIPVLALDGAFYGALLLALGSSFAFAFDPRRLTGAIIAGVSIGLAIWGRGNSLPVVGMVVAWPLLLAVWKAWRARDLRTWSGVLIVAAIAGWMTISFYVTYWGPITTYYSDHMKFVERHTWDLKDALPYIKNMPAIMYWRHEDSPWTIALSWLSHVVALAALLLTWWRGGIGAPERRTAYRHLAGAGTLIYFGTYATNLTLFTDPLFNVYNSALVWRPMTFGLSLCVIVLIQAGLDCLDLRRTHLAILPLGALALAWGVLWTNALTPWEAAGGRPDPRTVERFAVEIDHLIGKSGRIGILWFGNYNPPILRYYRLKNDLGDLPFYAGRNWDHIWSPTDYSEENRKRVRAEIQEQFSKADVVIVPEYLDEYSPAMNFALFHFKYDWATWLNSPEAPSMRVIMILQDSPDTRLLVLQRADRAGTRGDPWHLPYGNRPATPPPDYSAAVTRFN